MIKNFIKKKILGYSLPQEYTCLALETINDPLDVTVTIKGHNTFLNVSDEHLFLGYKPLIIGIPITNSSPFYDLLNTNEEICLSFHEPGFKTNMNWREFPSFDGSVARIIVKKKQLIACGENTLFLYEGIYGKHKFINGFNQFINKQREKRRIDRNVNINLSGNLGDQVHIAYSVPRVISIITLSDNNKMNMFPTDLHGPVGHNFYAGSLRYGGKANEQVEKLNKIVLSRVNVSCYKQAYALGKNHMQDLKDFSSFLTSSKNSTIFNIPLPESVISYHELQRIDSVDIGIHRIHSYRVVNKLKAADSKTLCHIHRYYAQWRVNNDRTTKFYWR